MFEKFRQMKTTVWVAASGFMVFIFFVWGIGDEFGRARRGRNPNEVGRVNGHPITGAAYESMVGQQRARMQQQQNGREVDDRAELQIRSQTWTSFVENALV